MQNEASIKQTNPLEDARREMKESSSPYFECRGCKDQGICPVVNGHSFPIVPEHPEKCWMRQIAMHPEGHRLLISVLKQVGNEAGMIEVRKVHLAKVVAFLTEYLESGGRIVQANMGALPPMGGRRRR